jgi:hypothetical protein
MSATGHFLTCTAEVFTFGYASTISFGSKATSVAAKGSTNAGRVFWSGGDDAMNAAMKYAKANGGTTLEMTRAGQNLTKGMQ